MLEELYRPVEAELAQVRQEVARLWRDALFLVEGASATLPGSGGKLLRPALCLLSAGACGAPGLSPYIPLATACEVLHMAALTHDDIVDKAGLRRGGLSLNALWDDRTAVLGGDYLVAQSVNLLVSLDSCAVIGEIFAAIREMTEGELRSIGRKGGDPTEADCLQLAKEKTATYFAASCTTAAHLAAPQYRPALHEYGLRMGIAFQLIDDILDIVQSEKTLGKPSCGDLAEGKKTLPILYLQEALDPHERATLQGMAGRPLTDAERAWAAERLTATGARARAEAVARTYADAAREALTPLPQTPFKDSMLKLIEFVLVRGS